MVHDLSSASQWSATEFSAVEFQDVRLNRRCQALAAQLSQQPQAPVNQASDDWADTKAAYRFFQNEKVTPARIGSPHFARTVERMRPQALVLAVQDTTFFNYTHHPQTEGLGEIGNKRQQQRGFALHSTLAVTPSGVPLGLLTQSFWVRPVGQPSHRPQDLRRQPIEEKESYRWLQALEQTLALTPAGVQVVTVCDREADIYEMFSVAQERAAVVLVRAATDRVLLEPGLGNLWARLERQPRAGTLVVDLTGNGQRLARQATVSVRFTRLTLKPPWRPHRKKLPPVHLTALLVREARPPAEVGEPLEWLLLTNWPVAHFAEAVQVVEWYRCRGQIEVFHKILKSGCRVEDCRLQTADRLQNYIALMSVIAWRLHWLTYFHQAQPDSPCTVCLTPTEWQALYVRMHPEAALPNTPPSVQETMRWIARLGGFLGRRHDGEPGATVIWRGWQRLQDIAETWALATLQSRVVGNR